MESINVNLGQNQNISRTNFSSNSMQTEKQVASKNEDFNSDDLNSQIKKFNSKQSEYKNYLKKQKIVENLIKEKTQHETKIKKINAQLSKLLSEK
ncbi:MAG: hypothetical protein ACI4NE_02690 [Succinivibrio sp.]